jgi:hypothetical protein
MSCDIFVQDIPEHAVSVDDIPEDFEPGLLMPRSMVIDAILKVAPFSDVSDPTWARIHGHGADIEVSLGDDELLAGFAFHVPGGDASVGIIAGILEELGLRAFDRGSETGIFDAAKAGDSLKRWLEYRDSVLSRGGANDWFERSQGRLAVGTPQRRRGRSA